MLLFILLRVRAWAEIGDCPCNVQEFEAKYARANAAKEALVADLDNAQAKVTQVSVPWSRC